MSPLLIEATFSESHNNIKNNAYVHSDEHVLDRISCRSLAKEHRFDAHDPTPFGAVRPALRYCE